MRISLSHKKAYHSSVFSLRSVGDFGVKNLLLVGRVVPALVLHVSLLRVLQCSFTI